MDTREFSLIAKAIRTYYPRENILPSNEAVMLWYEQLQDLDYNTTAAALKKWVATNKWSPSIADIREITSSISNPAIKDWSEAWEEARKAVRRFGRYNPEDAMASLDELTRETVKRMGYYDLCASENHDADRANFRMIYERIAKDRKTENQMPESLKKMIGILADRVSIEQKGGD